jgi:hypothetical protein
MILVCIIESNLSLIFLATHIITVSKKLLPATRKKIYVGLLAESYNPVAEPAVSHILLQ